MENLFIIKKIYYTISNECNIKLNATKYRVIHKMKPIAQFLNIAHTYTLPITKFYIKGPKFDFTLQSP